jgi:hypothetical protein
VVADKQDRKALLAYKVVLGLVAAAQLAVPAYRAQLDHKVFKALQDHRVLLELLVPLAFKVYRVPLAFKAALVLRELQV